MCTNSSSHGVMFESRLTVSCGQIGTRVVTALVVVVFHVQAGEFRETDAQGAATVVDVLSIQSLGEKSKCILKL